MLNPPTAGSIIKATGLVFGDIGTSPIYTLAVLFLLLPPTEENIMGIISLIFWTMTILVTLQYAILGMRLSENGEGGTIVLKELLIPLLGNKLYIAGATLLAITGISLMIGDCVLTPAISILSAVEGIRHIPGQNEINQSILVFLAIIITFLLFFFQRKGSEKVAAYFGPIMAIWFITLTLTGLASIIQTPSIIMAISPIYALNFFEHNFIEAFISLSLVILCATGAEALFADMGHLGREPIRWAWIFVFLGILISYMGQGAFMIRTVSVENPLFEMISSEIPIIYIPFLILTISATIIASQAVISGIFSIIYQAINTHLLPMLKVEYTSTELRTQIYLDSINWMLCAAVIFVLLVFGYSERLANAYGIAVTGTMLIDASLMIAIYTARKTPLFIGLAGIVFLTDAAFFISLLTKVFAGGYWSLILASIPFATIIIYIKGQEAMYQAISPMPWSKFNRNYIRAYNEHRLIRGTGLFFSRSLDQIPAYISRTMFTNEIIYEKNVIISINITDKPLGCSYLHKTDISPGLSHLSISYGYMQVIDLMKIIHKAGIEEKTIFYGMEEIVSRKFVWKLFYAIKRLCPSFVQYYRLPHNKVHGVVTRIEL